MIQAGKRIQIARCARTGPNRGLARVALLVFCVGLVASCSYSVVPPSRTLPTHINRIYIREFKNNSRLFGAQADLTLHVNDEFMLDGRLDVVQSERSDVRLEGKIKSFREYANGFGGDEFPLISTMEMVCTVELWDPYDPDRLVPISRYSIPTIIQYVSDARRSISETQTEARERLMRQAAKNIVLSVMQGQPGALRGIDQKNIERYNERRGADKFEPVITQPRFPKPTPVPSRNR